jgi:hypothetical protein
MLSSFDYPPARNAIVSIVVVFWGRHLARRVPSGQDMRLCRNGLESEVFVPANGIAPKPQGSHGLLNNLVFLV